MCSCLLNSLELQWRMLLNVCCAPFHLQQKKIGPHVHAATNNLQFLCKYTWLPVIFIFCCCLRWKWSQCMHQTCCSSLFNEGDKSKANNTNTIVLVLLPLIKHTHAFGFLSLRCLTRAVNSKQLICINMNIAVWEARTNKIQNLLANMNACIRYVKKKSFIYTSFLFSTLFCLFCCLFWLLLFSSFAPSSWTLSSDDASKAINHCFYDCRPIFWKYPSTLVKMFIWAWNMKNLHLYNAFKYKYYIPVLKYIIYSKTTFHWLTFT